MKQLATTPILYSEDLLTKIRELVLLSSEVIANCWPMRNFVHHNPLHGLEHLHFEEAVRHGHRFLGGKGYLSCEIFRDYVRSGRILPHHINAALKPLSYDRYVILGNRKVTHLELLQIHLLQGITAPAEETLEALVDRHPDRLLLGTLAKHVIPVLKPLTVSDMIEVHVREEQMALGWHHTLGDWCNRILGTQITQQINQELIKWCEAFLDEGHAAWPMPGREKGFYGAWKFLAGQEWSPCEIQDSQLKITCLPEDPAEVLLSHLTALSIPVEAWQDYLTFHLTALPGWAGFIKWRSDQTEYEWQQAYPVDLVQYLAVRVWYERELVRKACLEQLGIDGNVDAISSDMQKRPYLYFMMRERIAGHLPALYAEQFGRLCHRGINSRNTKKDELKVLAKRYAAELTSRHAYASQYAAALRLFSLAVALEITPDLLMKTSPEDLRVLLEWLDAFPESAHGPIWLKAFEIAYQEQLIGKISLNLSNPQIVVYDATRAVRPQAQVIFCIDTRSEPFRRHLEAIGNYETFGFAGFFSVFIRYRALGNHHETNQFPAIAQAKNTVRELPRTYHGQFLPKHLARARLVHSGHKLLHDLKENVVTPYIMVESLGWFYCLPFIGKTFFRNCYQNWVNWLWRVFVPPIATTLTVDQLSSYEVEEILVAEQRSTIHRALQARFGNRGWHVCHEWLETLRRRALNENGDDHQHSYEPNPSFNLSAEEEMVFLEELRRDYRINRTDALARMERIIKTGINFSDQVFTLENALRMMGLTRNFARLVLFCAHGSSSENNPYEAALDCGACGGNGGSPNARVLATMANKPLIRQQLARNGISIPRDTYFIAGQHNTTTDEVQIFDLEDIPHTHQNDLIRLTRDLKEAGLLNSQERCTRFPDITATLTPHKAARLVRERSFDWSQVRPEWGLAGNAAFIIAPRKLTRGINLEGRVFLQSYDYREDPTGQLLDTLMTTSQVVGQWINMEHYFSSVDNEVYGSGSKIYHNVVGRFGIMFGPQSDLRTGLARQSVMDGQMPYHEPMRLFTLIEAPRDLISRIIRNHRILQHYYDNEWVYLATFDPEEKIYYRYIPKQGWMPLRDEWCETFNNPSLSHD
ncbi:MAG: DUF2309 domain-containing protein [wastewater metagenome]|nr:DUF2309 domain-containing protein [Candidatus Loosdrechtia aerotolerans]